MEIPDRIRRGFDLFNERDWDTVQRGLPADFLAIDHVPPDKREAHGPNAMREITEVNGDAAFADLRMEATDVKLVMKEEGRVVAVVRVVSKASGGASDVPVDAEIAQVWTFENGVATRFEQFRTWDEAERAAARD